MKRPASSTSEAGGSDHARPSLSPASSWSQCSNRRPDFASDDPARPPLEIGLRTFYRELDLLKKCGIKVRRDVEELTSSRSTMAEAEHRMPFPDPQLSFAEMAELSGHPGDAARRLAEILRSVVEPPKPAAKKRRKKKAEG